MTFPEGYLVLQLFWNAPWSVKTVALNLSGEREPLSLTACWIFVFFMTCREQNQSWLWTLLAVTSARGQFLNVDKW